MRSQSLIQKSCSGAASISLSVHPPNVPTELELYLPLSRHFLVGLSVICLLLTSLLHFTRNLILACEENGEKLSDLRRPLRYSSRLNRSFREYPPFCDYLFLSARKQDRFDEGIARHIQPLETNYA